MTTRQPVRRLVAVLVTGVLLLAGLVLLGVVRGHSGPLDRASSPAPVREQVSPAVASTGAPTRTTPASYGAVGNGVADDTAALQAALDSLGPGDTLALPAGGLFRHSDVLLLRRPGSRLVGPGVLLASAEGASSLQIQADDVTVEGVVLRITATTRRWTGLSQHRLVVGPYARTVVTGVRVDGAAGAGIFVNGARGFRISDVVVRDTRADGIHMTAAASGGLVERPVVSGTGDDGVAVVSYQGDRGPTTDITVVSPRVSRNSHGRGVSVVGGEDITYRDVRVDGSSAAAVYLATEGAPFFTRDTRRVRVLGLRATDSNRTGAVDHGAVLVYAGARGSVVEDVLVQDALVRATRQQASRQVGLLADVGRLLRVRLMDVTIEGGGPVFQVTARTQDFRTSGWVVDGAAVPDRGTG